MGDLAFENITGVIAVLSFVLAMSLEEKKHRQLIVENSFTSDKENKNYIFQSYICQLFLGMAKKSFLSFLPYLIFLIPALFMILFNLIELFYIYFNFKGVEILECLENIYWWIKYSIFGWLWLWWLDRESV